MRPVVLLLASMCLAALACDRADDRDPPPGEAAEAAEARRGVATAIASGRGELSPEELETGRHDPSWRRYAQPDGAGRSDNGRPARTRRGAAAESWDEITADRINGMPRLPVSGNVQGPSVAKIQIMLDQARFSPGVIDGRWGKNTEKAVYFFQAANDVPATGEVDRATLDALSRRARAEQVRPHRLTERDLEGPLVELPEDIYQRAELECLCYESVREKLGEVFHSSPELLEQLNPDVDLNTLSPGDFLQVPAVERFRVGELPEGRYREGGEVQRIVISVGGHYLHALGGDGNVLYHFPSTLGADYSPSPADEFVVESITFLPEWHYQPRLLPDVDPEEADAVIPAGPNNDVGVVWMALSEPHYGIHGTRAPEAIGYASSAGCVRLTNWDAAFLAQRVPEDVTVEFIHVEQERP